MTYKAPHFAAVNFRIDDHSYSAPAAASTDFAMSESGWNGDGYISGTVSIQGTPTENCVVRLFNSSGQFILETTTDVLGDYLFENLDLDERYDVIAQDSVKFWEKKIRSLVAPLAMP